jgi:hypothetical protein
MSSRLGSLIEVRRCSTSNGVFRKIYPRRSCAVTAVGPLGLHSLLNSCVHVTVPLKSGRYVPLTLLVYSKSGSVTVDEVKFPISIC